LSRASRDACSTACERESRCLAYTYSGGNCDLFDRTDFAERNESAQSGVKAQYP
jgi:hypothetical protein